MRHVVILVHRSDTFDARYMLHEIARIWRERHDIQTTVLRGISRWRQRPDLAILHVDRSVVPDNYLQFIRQFPVALNIRAVDTSKRAVSNNLVYRGDGYDGPAIVKTNHPRARGKLPRTVEQQRNVIHLAARTMRRVIPWSLRSTLRSDDYPTFKTVSAIPRSIWSNPNLIVERHLIERRDGWYCLRTWTFLGHKETSALCFSRQPIVTSASIVKRETVSEVPTELRRLRRQLGLDFGQFQFVESAGRVVLYGATRTPTIDHLDPDEYEPEVNLLAEGITTWL